MQIDSKVLKSLLKHLSGVKAETFTLDTVKGRASARDQEMGIVLDTPLLRAAEPFEQHVLAVNLRKLSTTVAKMSGAVSLAPTERILEVRARKARVTLEVLKGKPTADVVLENASSLPLSTVLPILRYAAAAAEPNRAAPTGGVVELKVKNGEYRAAATDTNRLHLATAPAEYDCSLLHVPLPAIGVLAGLGADKVEMAQTERTLLFRAFLDSLTVTLQATRLSKQFPPYDLVFPTNFTFTGVLEPAAFKEALETVAPMVGDSQDDGAVRLEFLRPEKVLSIGSYGNQNSAEDSVAFEPADTGPDEDDIFGDKQKPEVKFSLRIKPLLDFVSAAKEPITFSGNLREQPVVLRSGNHTLLLSATLVGVA